VAKTGTKMRETHRKEKRHPAYQQGVFFFGHRLPSVNVKKDEYVFL
jgi:hypothetical protein